LNKLHFFRVDERPNVPMGYVLLSVIWGEGTYCQSLNAEGGAVRAVYRTRAGALEAARAIDWSPGDPCAWAPVGSDLFDPETYWALAMDGGPRFDIVPVELPGIERTTRKVHLVVRHIAEYAWNEERVPEGRCRSHPRRARGRVPPHARRVGVVRAALGE
jgi:hypothetical protein